MRLAAALAAGVTLAALMTACSSDGTREGGADGAAVDRVSPAQLQLKATVTRVQGALSKSGRKGLERHAEVVIGRYLEAAYLQQRPAAREAGSFPGFTRGARELALKDRRVVSGDAFRRADEVRPGAAKAFISVVAPKGRPVGATARVSVNLAVSEDERTRQVQVAGRLLLTPAGHSWRIFGYDLAVLPVRSVGRGR